MLLLLKHVKLNHEIILNNGLGIKITKNWFKQFFFIYLPNKLHAYLTKINDERIGKIKLMFEITS